jgi:hypothetical protein
MKILNFVENLETEGNVLYGRVKSLSRRIENVSVNVEVSFFAALIIEGVLVSLPNFKI